MIIDYTGKLKSLSGITRFALGYLLVLCCVVWGHFTIKNASTLMGCQVKKNLGITSPCIVPRLVTHMKHLHTYFAEISSFVFSQ